MATRKKEPRLTDMLEALARDWKIEPGFPADKTFQSMYTNIYGERWWCRTLQDASGAHQLLVWGDDVESATTKRGGATATYPWIMHDEEQLWLRANVQRLKEVERDAAVARQAT
jgi:hypothetical protein